MVNCCVCSCSCGGLVAVPVAGFSSQSYLNIVKQYCFLVFFLIRFLNSLNWHALFADECFLYISLCCVKM